MSYTIYADSDLLYDPRVPEYTLIDPTLDLKVNEPGLLSFVITNAHPSAGQISKLVSRIKVYQDGQLVFLGRVIKDERQIGHRRKYTAEGCLAYLIDSVCDPYEFTGTPAQFFSFMIMRHNATVSAVQQLTLGSCTIESEDEITLSSELFTTTWQVLKDKLIDAYGGYLYMTFDQQGSPIVNWLAEPPDTATQAIRFSENLVDIAVERDADETFTACVPQGAKMKAIDSHYDTEARLSIADVNDGNTHLIDTENAAIYGIIYAPISQSTWENITTPTALLHKGQALLANAGTRLKETITLTAVDLHSLDANVEAFHFLDRVIVSCGEICPEAEFVITEMSIPLQNPAGLRITIGESRTSLVAENSGRMSDAESRIENIESDYVTNSEVVEVVQHEITDNTSIIQSAQQIILTALEDYVKTSDFNAFQSTVATSLSVMAGTIEANFTETSSEISTMNGEVSQQFESIRSFIRLISSGIVIGRSNSQIKLKLENNILYFFTGDEDSVSTENAIAYFSSGKLYVNVVEILTGMKIGPFAWMPESANLNFKLME